MTRTVDTFPTARIRSHSGGLPVEVALIAQLGIGYGDQLIAGASMRQRGHETYVDALDEPSARIGGVDIERGDATSLYTFAVGAKGHPFHRHAGHRVFTAISGSGGAQLRFSTASPAQIDEDPQHFVRGLHHVNIPADSLFTVRFGGGTWHQFAPLHGRSPHSALFALSCHTNEFGGDLTGELRERVAANEADIPSLTEVLPDALRDVLAALDPVRVPTVALSLHAAPVSLTGRICAWARSASGRVRGGWGRWRGAKGFLAHNGGGRVVAEQSAPPADSLLRSQLPDAFDHEDSFSLVTDAGELGTTSAREAMAAVLEGFIENNPPGVSRLMALRNVLVKPLGLRTSPLGCPVSSLLSPQADVLFANRFPVIAQRGNAADTRVEVVLGADDKHLRFRSCVGVDLCGDGRAVVTLGTRVRTTNLFGRSYMALIDRVHRRYITPTMLRLAVDHAVRGLGASGAG
ncbi:DUF2867 domain-containing protein [Lysobacter psychrotolerans]|uniref:DUF2867 domain-containing protein n=1 Tax=Montanilutibacter psychrotolerans TaxID=1327343 RepID=UPI001CC1DE9E